MTLYEQYIQEVATLEAQELKDYYLAMIPSEGHTWQDEQEMNQFLLHRQRTKIREMQAPQNIRQTAP